MRDILHVDLNNFYASCECLINPEIRHKPVAVCGKQSERHGIVLAKNMLAKKMGVKTGHTIWEARMLCPNLVTCDANFPLYLEFSRKVRKILLDYTNLVEPFGIDESWLDVTNSKFMGSAVEIAEEIRRRVLNETGLTVSIGVSFNKIFAKLGSDYKKPNAITTITKENYKQIVWNMGVENLLGIGRATEKKLKKLGIEKIGELASLDIDFLRSKFGKWGEYLFQFSNGIGNDLVKNYYFKELPKSVGNSTTCYRDLTNLSEVDEVLTVLADSISKRMILGNVPKARTVKVWVRKNDLSTVNKQCAFKQPTNSMSGILNGAKELFRSFYNFDLPIRSLGISVCNFISQNEQLDLFSFSKEKKNNALDEAVISIREKFGENSIRAGSTLFDAELGKAIDHKIHPIGILH